MYKRRKMLFYRQYLFGVQDVGTFELYLYNAMHGLPDAIPIQVNAKHPLLNVGV